MAQTGSAKQAPTGSSQQGTVLFSRSSGAASQVQSAVPAVSPSVAASVTDGMREAPQFLSYDFVVHLDPSTASLEVLLRTTLRNAGAAPLGILPLQLSSSLHFEQIREGGRSLPFAAHVLQSDADHTGALTEAAVELPQPLAPGAQLALVIDYGGMIPPSSARLDRIGTPAALALQTDWDRIGEDFTGLRGFGDAVWYPVSSVPATFGEGAALFHEIGRQRELNQNALVTMNITEMFTGHAPNLAVLDGRRVSVGPPAALPQSGFPGLFRVALASTRLGFRTPSLVIATRIEAASNSLVQVGALPGDLAQAPAYTAAAYLLNPLFQEWFGSGAGAQHGPPLLLIDLPVKDASPAEDGDALLLSLAPDAEPNALGGQLVAPLTHVFFRSPRMWLEQGVAGLMRLLWVERTHGRAAALAELDSGFSALALAEPASPGAGTGQPLNQARDAVFYRDKATAIFWMLRMMVGDTILADALRAYDPQKDTGDRYFLGLLQHAVAQQSAAAGPGAGQLDWFFHDWIATDPGLPDLAIVNVFSSHAAAGNQWLAAVDISNSGYADAWVPVTVHSAVSATTVYVRVPARGDLSRRILVNGEPTEIDVNDGSVPEVEASVHRRVLR